MNAWSTGGLQPDLVLVVDGGDDPDGEHGIALTGAFDDLDAVAARRTLLDDVDTDPGRYIVCSTAYSAVLPAAVALRLTRLLAGLAARPAERPAAADTAVSGNIDSQPAR